MLLLALDLGKTPLGAQEDEETQANREYRIKAAYLYQFGRYVEWPAKAFSSRKAPFVIGVMEQDPIVPDLEQIAQIKKIQDRPIQDSTFFVGRRHPAVPHLVLSGSLPPETQAEIIRKAVRPGALLVGELSDTLDRGGTMQFVVEDNKIRVVISRKAAERAGFDHQRQVAPGRPCRRLA